MGAVQPVSECAGNGAAWADADLVRAALAGDARRFEELVRRYERPARAACFAVLRDWHLSQDAAQDGFVAAYTNLHSLKQPAAFGGWILTIMRRQATRLARRRRKREPPPAAALGEAAVSDGSPHREREMLWDAVRRLPEHERSVVLLRYFGGHDVAVIAALCGRPVGTITKQLSRAHRRLQTIIEKENRP